MALIQLDCAIKNSVLLPEIGIYFIFNYSTKNVATKNSTTADKWPACRFSIEYISESVRRRTDKE